MTDYGREWDGARRDTNEDQRRQVALAALVRINTQDMLESFGLGKVRFGRRLMAWACRWPARQFAEVMLEFDQQIARVGLRAAAAWGLRQFDADVVVHRPDLAPVTGPALFLSNHPGITDTLALFAATPRDDLLTIAAARPFLQSLEHVTRRLLYVDQDSSSNLGVVRAAARHLHAGAAILTFPAGKIEPDPQVMPGASAALEGWSDSISLFARLAPETQIVPVLVSGVFSKRSLHSPATHLRRMQSDRERFAAMLQVVAPSRYPVTVQVTFGHPFGAGMALDRSNPQAVKHLVVERMRMLIMAQDSGRE